LRDLDNHPTPWIASDFTQLPPLIIVVVLAMSGFPSVCDSRPQETDCPGSSAAKRPADPNEVAACFYSFTERNDTFYEVTLSPFGKQFTAIGKCNMLHGALLEEHALVSNFDC